MKMETIFETYSTLDSTDAIFDDFWETADNNFHGWGNFKFVSCSANIQSTLVIVTPNVSRKSLAVGGVD